MNFKIAITKVTYLLSLISMLCHCITILHMHQMQCCHANLWIWQLTCFDIH